MTLHEYWKVIQHRWILIVACLLVAAGLAWLITPASTERTAQVGSYTATATLLVGRGPNGSGADQSASLGRVKLFVTTGEIPVRAAEALNFGGNPAVLAARITVEEVESAQAITISTVASNGTQAADTVNTFARESVRYFDEGHQGTGNARLTILQEATPIPSANSPILTLPAGRLPRAGLAALLGLLVGFGIALILDRLDSRLRTRQEVHEALSMPVIAQVPRLTRSQRASGKLGVVAEPLGQYANGYRAARTALMHLPGQQVPGEWGPQRPAPNDSAPNDQDGFQPAQVVLVSSAFESEGKTTSVANLAASFAETGQSVLVLDCDLRSPDAHNYFDVPQGAGISDHLVQGSEGAIRSLVRPTNVSGVYIITAGTRLDHPAALTSRLGPIMEQARTLADVVIVDTAPLLAASDVFDVLPLVDTVVLAVRSGRLTEAAGNRVAELLGRFQVPVTGTILIGAPARRSEGYGSRYGYGYGYGDPKKKDKKAARVKSLPAKEVPGSSQQRLGRLPDVTQRSGADHVEPPTWQRPVTPRDPDDDQAGVDDALRP